MVTTDGHLLGGRIKHRQPAEGFRTGIEPALLAASVPARAGDRVLEAGTGSGAALLCLSARVPGVLATGVEDDPAMARLAAANAEQNGFESVEVIAGRIETVPLPRPFDHAIANPPYHPPGGPGSSDPGKERAKRGADGLIHDWIERLGGALRGGGSLTLIVRAALIPNCLEAMAEFHCPCTAIYPLWPKIGRPAKLVLLRGIKGSRSPLVMLAGLVLHRPDGGFTGEAQAVFDGPASLSLAAARGA